jgi:hypothetical protein
MLSNPLARSRLAGGFKPNAFAKPALFRVRRFPPAVKMPRQPEKGTPTKVGIGRHISAAFSG